MKKNVSKQAKKASKLAKKNRVLMKNNINFDILFSIIMPTYNRKFCIDNAIDSILSQTYTGYELIIVDDGSTDGTQEYIEQKYKNEIKNGTIKYIYKCNEGVCKARNCGLVNSKNDWIAYIDSDNSVKEDFLETYVKAINENKNSKLFYAKLQYKNKGIILGKDFDIKELIRHNFIDLGVFVHHKEYIERYGMFDENMSRLVDWELIVRYTLHEVPFFIDKVVLIYNDSDGYERITNSANYFNNLAYFRKKHSPEYDIVTTMITTYNHENYIGQAIESAIKQQGDFIHEIIISDDASTDKTPEIIAKYADQYPYLIKNLSSRENVGISQNMKRCFEAASGKYIAVLEGDDYWISNKKLELQKNFLDQNQDCSMVFSRVKLFSEKTQQFTLLDRHNGLPEKLTGEDFVKELSLIVNFSCTMFYRRYLLNLPNILYKDRLSEIALAFYLEQKGKIGFISTPLSVYRQHENGVWSGADKAHKLMSSISCARTASLVCKKKYRAQLENGIIEKIGILDYLGLYQYSLPQSNRIKPYLMFPICFFRLSNLRKKHFQLLIESTMQFLHSMRVDVKNLGAADSSVQIVAPKANISQPAWFTNSRGKGQIIQSSELKQKLTIKAMNSGRLTISFRGIDKKDQNRKHFPIWVDYKSIKVDGKKINNKDTQTWLEQPFKYEMPVKEGQEVSIVIEQAYHKYTKTELKDILLMLNPNSQFILQNIDKLVEAIYQNIYPSTAKTCKVSPQKRILAFKDFLYKFLYNKVKTDTSTKTYICGIRVRKKPANIYEFIDKRLEAMSKNWEKKFADVVNSEAKNQKELLAQMASLNSACQKELKATGTALKKDISALQKETNLIKSNSLYMIKSLNDKMAEVMNSQTVSAGIMQSIQAENTAEVLNHLSKLPESVAENSSKNKIAIIEQIARLPENIAQSSSLNKAEILTSVAQIQENGNANRTEIIEQIARLPETIAQSSSLNKAEILASVAQMQENIKKNGNTNRTTILEQIAKVVNDAQQTSTSTITQIKQNGEKNKKELTQNIKAISEKIIDIDDRLRSCRTEIIERVDNIKNIKG